MKDLISAEADYTEALTLNHEYTDAYFYRGHLRINSQDVKGALEDFNEVIVLVPNRADGYRGRAKCYQRMAVNESDPVRKKELMELAEKDKQTAKSLG